MGPAFRVWPALPTSSFLARHEVGESWGTTVRGEQEALAGLRVSRRGGTMQRWWALVDRPGQGFHPAPPACRAGCGVAFQPVRQAAAVHELQWRRRGSRPCSADYS